MYVICDGDPSSCLLSRKEVQWGHRVASCGVSLLQNGHVDIVVFARARNSAEPAPPPDDSFDPFAQVDRHRHHLRLSASSAPTPRGAADARLAKPVGWGVPGRQAPCGAGEKDLQQRRKADDDDPAARPSPSREGRRRGAG
jgi:hypothetical protein